MIYLAENGIERLG